MSKLDEILYKVWDLGFQAHKATLVSQNRIDEREFRQKASDEATQAIIKLVEELIGEDVNCDCRPRTPYHDITCASLDNSLRAEIRKKIEAL